MEDRIDSIISKEAIDKERVYLDSVLDTWLTKIKSFSGLKISLQGAESIKELNAAATQFAKTQNDLILIEAKASRELAAAKAIEEKTRRANDDATRKQTESAKKLNVEQKLEKQIIDSKSGSYDKLNAQLKLLQFQYKKLSDAERQTALGKDLFNQINTTKDALKNIDASIGDHQRNVGNYKSALDKLGDTFESVGRRILAFAGITALISFFKSTIQNGLEAEEVTARFKGVLDNLGRADVFVRLKTAAEGFLHQFKIFDDEDFIGVFNQLITYGKLTEKQILQLTPVIADFAAKSGSSLADATSIIIKALEGNGKALKEYGIDIKNAKTESERLEIVMTTLKDKVNGAAEAFGESTQGKIKASKVEFENLKEEIGTGLLPTINRLLEGLNGLLKGFKRMGDDGIGEVLRKTFRGFKNIVVDRDFVKQAQDISDDINKVKKGAQAALNEDAKNVFTQPGDTFTPGDNKILGIGGNDAKAKAAKESATKEKEITDRTAEDILKSQFEVNKLKIQQNLDASKRIIDDETKSYTERLAALREFGQSSLGLAKLEKDFEVNSEDQKLKQIITGLEKQKKEKGANIKAINEQEEKEYDASRERLKLIEAKYQNQLLTYANNYVDEQKKLYDKNYENRKANADQFRKLEEDEAEFVKKIQKSINDAAQKDKDNAINTERDKQAELKKLREEAVGNILSIEQSIGDAKFDNQKNRIQEQINLLDEKTSHEIDAVNASARSEQDKASAITIIQAKAEAERESLIRKQKKVDYDKARFDKEIAILQILAQIALALSKGQFAAAATAGAALVKLVVTPIPKFKTGTKNAPKGWAQVSEEGPELVETKSGHMYLTPAQPSLINLMGGERITPAQMTNNLLKSANSYRMIMQAQGKVQQMQTDTIYENPLGIEYAKRQLRELEVMNRKMDREQKAPIIDNSFYHQFHIKY